MGFLQWRLVVRIPQDDPRLTRIKKLTSKRAPRGRSCRPLWTCRGIRWRGARSPSRAASPLVEGFGGPRVGPALKATPTIPFQAQPARRPPRPRPSRPSPPKDLDPETDAVDLVKDVEA